MKTVQKKVQIVSKHMKRWVREEEGKKETDVGGKRDQAEKNPRQSK